MKPRRPSRKAWDAHRLHILQKERLQAIARGACEPLFRHELYFSMCRDDGLPLDMNDFILPGLMFLAEVAEYEQAEGEIPSPLAGRG